jgi:hypothetical protein
MISMRRIRKRLTADGHEMIPVLKSGRGESEMEQDKERCVKKWLLRAQFSVVSVRSLTTGEG